jgi:probable HAF family extracellular repeat protein
MINSRTARLLLFSAMLVLLSAPLALAQGTYTQIDVPGANATNCNGIDTADDIVGVYDAGSPIAHGFLLSGGIFTTIDRPGFAQSGAFGINDVGQIVGSNDPSNQAFIYDIATQTFTEIGYPGALITFPSAINNAGAIAGTVSDTGLEETGFELVGSTYRIVAPPNVTTVRLSGITASGEIVGNAYGAGGVMNFFFFNGKYERIPFTGAIPIVTGVNPSGTALVGYYKLHSGAQVGFLHQGSSHQELNFPSSMHTLPSGINNGGMVVGTFSDSDGNVHGFLWTPPAAAVRK